MQVPLTTQRLFRSNSSIPLILNFPLSNLPSNPIPIPPSMNDSDAENDFIDVDVDEDNDKTSVQYEQVRRGHFHFLNNRSLTRLYDRQPCQLSLNPLHHGL